MEIGRIDSNGSITCVSALKLPLVSDCGFGVGNCASLGYVAADLFAHRAPDFGRRHGRRDAIPARAGRALFARDAGMANPIIRDRRPECPVLAALVALSVALTIAGCGVLPVRREPETLSGTAAIAALDALGRVEFDNVQPSRPVVKVLLKGCQVTDATLGLLDDLGDVRELELEDTSVTDEGIRRLQHLTKLQTLRLDGVAITDDGLALLASFKDLETLGLSDTHVKGPGLGSLKSLPNLRCLVIEGRLENTDRIGELTQLTCLALYDTQLKGSQIAFLKHLINLEDLSFDDITLTVRDLAVIHELPRLRRLRPGVAAESREEFEAFLQANSNLEIIRATCRTPAENRRYELEKRRQRREALAGRVRRIVDSIGTDRR
jgi:hypothetical protein